MNHSRYISGTSCSRLIFTLFVVYESQTISFPSCDALTKFLEEKEVELIRISISKQLRLCSTVKKKVWKGIPYRVITKIQSRRLPFERNLLAIQRNSTLRIKNNPNRFILLENIQTTNDHLIGKLLYIGMSYTNKCEEQPAKITKEVLISPAAGFFWQVRHSFDHESNDSFSCKELILPTWWVNPTKGQH